MKKVSVAFGVIFVAATLLYPVASRGDWSFRWVYFIIAFLGIPAIFELSKASLIDRALGDLSYPLYICHVAVFELTRRLSEHAHWRFANIDIEFVGAFVAAFLLNRLVIKRVEALRWAPARAALGRRPAPPRAIPAAMTPSGPQDLVETITTLR